LPKETRGYVPAFIAANYAMTYYCEHGICPMNSRLPVKTDTVMLNRNVTFQQIAQVCGLDVEMIRSLNPVYRRDMVPGLSTPSPLRLPLTDMPRFLDMQDSIYALAGTQSNRRAEVEIATTPAPQQQQTRNRRNNNQNNASYVTVRRGDTLGALARRNNTTVARLRQLNGIRGNNIRIGQRIRVR
jgi:membrane-bound lytic murein transglycosylase D